MFIDVRSPGEYAKNKIPGALNVPVFFNQEREELGKIYHQENSMAARRRGIELASTKLPHLVDHIAELVGDNTPILYCWRGGLRSLGVQQILTLAGIPALRIRGGYKAYRRFINKSLQNYSFKSQPIILHGLTGTGKTLIIKELFRQGFPTIDIEGMACHRGSIFGKIGYHHSPTQKDFEAMLWHKLQKYKDAPCLVMEKEGKKLGNLFLPKPITWAMEEGTHLLLHAPLEVRARRIAAEYIPYQLSTEEKEQFRNAINQLSSRLGNKMAGELIKLLEAEKYYECAFILCRDYYDQHYPDARPQNYAYSAHIDTTSISSATGEIIKFIEGLNRSSGGNKLKIN